MGLFLIIGGVPDINKTPLYFGRNVLTQQDTVVKKKKKEENRYHMLEHTEGIQRCSGYMSLPDQ